MPLDVSSRAVDEVSVVHLDRTSGHARQAGETAIEVMYRLGIRRAPLLQHGTDEFNTPTWGIVLVASENICWTGIGAEAEMHTRLEDHARLRDLRIRQLRGRKVGAHSRSCTLAVRSRVS